VGVARFFLVWAQLGLLLLAIGWFGIGEMQGLVRLAPFLFAGFAVHAWLPPRWRPPFFLLLSLLALERVLGARNGAWVVFLGVLLVGACHLAIPYAARVALLLGCGSILAAIHAGWIGAPWGTPVLPVLGSMFMFRLILYAYDLRHETQHVSPWRRLSYFFLLPNVCFPMFPVVDYATYRRTYYDAPAEAIYGKGIRWMLRGITHLLLYRLVYQYLTPAPAEVVGLGSLVLFIVSTYLLYLRISGQFHLIVGILCLFGHDLPETNHLYYLATSFNDYWRRINIYWKDFIMKVFYYPVFMSLPRWGFAARLVAATVVAFVFTWLLHSYQWFWLRRSFPLAATDLLFWAALGALLVVNSVVEARGKRRRPAARRTLRADARAALQAVGMFCTMSVLWSLWSSTSVGEWLALVSVVRGSRPGEMLLLALGLAAAVAAGIVVQRLVRGMQALPSRVPATATAAGALVLAALAAPGVESWLGPRAGEVLAVMKGGRGMAERDDEVLERGYYEGLLGSWNSQVWEAQVPPPPDWLRLEQLGAVRPTDDARRVEFVPDLDIVFHRAPFRTNRWGFRGRDYEKEHPADTYRIAFLGSSYVLGGGVPGEETFASLTEERLTREAAGGAYRRYEVLNFGAGGSAVVEAVVTLEKKALDFHPDAVFYFAHQGDTQRTVDRLILALQEGKSIPSGLREILDRAGVEDGAGRLTLQRRLRPLRDEIRRWGYGQIVEACRRHGAVPAWAFLPATHRRVDREEVAELRAAARESGFVTLSLEAMFEGQDWRTIRLAPWDTHPNARAHRLIANALFDAMRAEDRALGLDLSGAGLPAATGAR
jgi:D-alanyl-lipoteichoic acid acyltransferase DltB (MBOAT superfamily)